MYWIDSMNLMCWSALSMIGMSGYQYLLTLPPSTNLPPLRAPAILGPHVDTLGPDDFSWLDLRLLELLLEDFQALNSQSTILATIVCFLKPTSIPPCSMKNTFFVIVWIIRFQRQVYCGQFGQDISLLEKTQSCSKTIRWSSLLAKGRSESTQSLCSLHFNKSTDAHSSSYF